MIKKHFYSILVVSLFFWTATELRGQEQASAPVFKEGDTWQFNFVRKGGITSSTEFNDGTYELAFVQGKVKLFEVNGNQKLDIQIQPDGPTQGLLSMVGQSDQRQILKFPISVGQKWTYQYVTRPQGRSDDQRRSVEVNVIGSEQVTTPAGTYKAFKLARSESWSAGKRGGQGGETATYFFSPETRSVIKSSHQSEGAGASVEVELIKFVPGK